MLRRPPHIHLLLVTALSLLIMACSSSSYPADDLPQPEEPHLRRRLPQLFFQGVVAKLFERLDVQGLCRWDIAALTTIVALTLVLRLVSLATIPPAEAAAERPGFDVIE